MRYTVDCESKVTLSSPQVRVVLDATAVAASHCVVPLNAFARNDASVADFMATNTNPAAAESVQTVPISEYVSPCPAALAINVTTFAPCPLPMLVPAIAVAAWSSAACLTTILPVVKSSGRFDLGIKFSVYGSSPTGNTNAFEQKDRQRLLVLLRAARSSAVKQTKTDRQHKLFELPPLYRQ